MRDRETCAVCRACMGFGFTLIGLRGILDGRAPLTRLADWTRHLDLIDPRLAAALDVTERAIANGLLDHPPRAGHKYPRRRLPSARKIVQWTVFSEEGQR